MYVLLLISSPFPLFAGFTADSHDFLDFLKRHHRGKKKSPKISPTSMTQSFLRRNTCNETSCRLVSCLAIFILNPIYLIKSQLFFYPSSANCLIYFAETLSCFLEFSRKFYKNLASSLLKLIRLFKF